MTATRWRAAALLAAALLLLSALAARAADAGRAATTVTLLHLSDTHGRLLPFELDAAGAAALGLERGGRIGGAARLASAVAAIRAARGADRVLLLHGGDAFADDLLGNLTRGEAAIRVLNAIGVQFMALGDHDFDYGFERTRELQRLARFPMRAANALDDQRQPVLGDPAQVFELGGVRIAVLALGSHQTPLAVADRAAVRGLRFASGIEAARVRVPALRRDADAVVVLSHQGAEVDRELAREVPGIDVIVGVPSQPPVTPPQKVGSTWIAQALPAGAALGELTLAFDDKRRLKGVDGRLHALWDDRYATDAAVASLVAAQRAPHLPALDAVVATAAERIERRAFAESPFDVLAAETLRRHSGADIAFLPGVGFGVALTPGSVTREALHQLLPHTATKLVTMELSGRQIVELLERSAANLRPAQPLDRVGGLIQSAGFDWTVDFGQPPGQRIRALSIHGRRLEFERHYRVVTTTGLLQGMHGQTTFAAGRNVVVTDYAVSDVVEAALRAQATIRAPAPGRVTVIDAGAVRAVPGDARADPADAARGPQARAAPPAR